MKVLILSCSTGGGHNSCARYIEEELKANNIECEFKDFFDIVNPKGKELLEEALKMGADAVTAPPLPVTNVETGLKNKADGNDNEPEENELLDFSFGM